jgi:hypothetical protein
MFMHDDCTIETDFFSFLFLYGLSVPAEMCVDTASRVVLSDEELVPFLRILMCFIKT